MKKIITLAILTIVLCSSNTALANQPNYLSHKLANTPMFADNPFIAQR